MTDVTDINQLLKDSAYAAIGFGVLGFQKAQVRRRELIEQLSDQGGQMAHLGDLLESVSDQVGSHLAHLGGQVTSQVGQLRDSSLPTPSVTAVRDQLAEVARLLDQQVQPVRRQLDDRLSEVEDLLPAQTRTIVQSLRNAAQGRQDALRSAVGLDA